MPASPEVDPLAARQRGSLSERVLYFGPALALALVLLILWSFVAWFSLVYPKSLLDDQRRELTETAQAAAVQTEAVLRDAETSVRTVNLWLQSQTQTQTQKQTQTPAHGETASASLAALANVLSDTSAQMVDVMLARADGTLWSIPGTRTQAANSPTDLSTNKTRLDAKSQEFFAQIAHQDQQALLVLGLPLKLQANGPSLLPMGLRLSAPTTDASVAVALIDLRRLAALHANFAHGLTGAVTMIRSDGIILSRTPELPGVVGRDAYAGRTQRRADVQERQGFFETDGRSTDGIQRLGAYRRLDGFNVVMLVSQGQNASLAGYLKQRRLALLLSTIISAMALGTTFVLSRLQRATRLRDAALLAASNASPLGLFRCDTTGRATYANEAYYRLFGLNEDEELAWAWLKWVPEADRAKVKTGWNGRMATAKPIHLTHHLQHPDGTSIEIALRTAPLLVDGRLVGHAGTVEDITERMAQRKAEQTLAAIFDMTPDYVCRVNMRGQLLYLNPAARRRLNLAPDASLAGLTQMRYHNEARMLRFKTEILPTAVREGHWHGRSGVLGPDGIEIPVDSTVLAHLDAEGQASTISLIMRDISDEVLALRQRQRTEAMMMAVAQSAQAMISVLDAQQCFLFFNDAFAQQFGATRDAWLGRPISALLSMGDFATCGPLIAAALQGERSTLELRLGNVATLKIVEAEFTPLLPASGEIEGVIWLARDVTNARLEEIKLRRASQTDPLTGLLNRSGFALGVDERLAQARQHNSQIALLYMDLDRFKPVNDQHGHPVGDALLKAVAGRLRHTLRPQDLVARLGGDEFAVLLSDPEQAADVAAVADKLVRAIAAPFRLEALQLEVGISIGYCMAPGAMADIDTLVAEADAKLYEAKRAGRGRSMGVSLQAD